MSNLATLAAAQLNRALLPDEADFLDCVEAGRPFAPTSSQFSATWLGWLLTNPAATAHVSVGGIQITGGPVTRLSVSGNWTAPFAKASFPIVLEHCDFDGPIDLFNSELCLLSFERCTTRAINLRAATLGWLRFRYQSKCNGTIDLALAKIARGADFTSASLVATAVANDRLSKYALLGDWLRSEGPLLFRGRPNEPRFSADGPIRLYGARVAGELDFRNSQLSAPGAEALNADQSVIEGTAAFADAIVNGSLEFVGSKVTGDFVADNLQLTGGQFDQVRQIARGLIGDHMEVGGSIYLRNGFRAEGSIRVYGAVIARDLECHGATFIQRGGVALNAASAEIGGSLQFADDDRPTLHSSITGKVDLTRAVIKGTLRWRKINPISGVEMLKMQSACVGTLADSRDAWPEKDHIDLHNFKCDAITDDSPLGAAQRTDWLSRSLGFSHQSYDQLASVLRKQGLYADARDVLYAKEARHAAEQKLVPGDRWWYGFPIGPLRFGFGPLAGYGYRFGTAFAVLLTTVAMCGVLYMLGARSLISPTGSNPPAFQSFAYSLDVFVPIVDFGQGNAWIPDARKGRILGHGPRGDLRTGGVLLCVYWFEIAIGWCVSSVLVGTITARLVRD